jgi:Flp pilus assembly protein TadG
MIAAFLSARLRGLLGDERGATIIEFAAVAPVLAIFVVGISDVSRGYSERLTLQQAANRTLELAHLGSTTQNYNFLIPEAAAAAGVPESSVELESWLECEGTRKLYTDVCADGEQIARYIKLSISKSFKPLFSSAGYSNVAADGSVPMKADASLRVQ